ncbi:head GIN domain-containing protein [Nonlabens xiamenensis]|uniref:head GIN domain-containing protein n=1 Tax=Nonlabens xiamenensis TaxID=2341043 RepID=UPI000F60C26B|nr:head GIN domain-containing protein [Nonlabens xiamenensis]
MKKIVYICVLFMAAQTAQAQWWSNGKRVKGNGEVITKTFNTSDYEGISARSSFDITIMEGEEGEIRVEAESNIMEYIEIEVNRGILKIGLEDRINITTREGVKVWVPVRRISSLSMAGSGDISSEIKLKSRNMEISVAGSGDIETEVECAQLEVNIAGSGDVKLTGRTESLNASVAGSGDISAFGLKANNVEASIAGSGDVSVYCNGGKLSASIVGSGDLRYKGSADKVKKSVLGSGDITHM